MRGTMIVKIEIKREVAAPYIVKTADGKSEKRGWDYENGKPMRWTGIGNCIYADILVCNIR